MYIYFCVKVFVLWFFKAQNVWKRHGKTRCQIRSSGGRLFRLLVFGCRWHRAIEDWTGGLGKIERSLQEWTYKYLLAKIWRWYPSRWSQNPHRTCWLEPTSCWCLQKHHDRASPTLWSIPGPPTELKFKVSQMVENDIFSKYGCIT